MNERNNYQVYKAVEIENDRILYHLSGRSPLNQSVDGSNGRNTPLIKVSDMRIVGKGRCYGISNLGS